jgi:hypothetical protein
MHLELCRVTNTHRRLVLDGIVQIGVIRVSGGQRALASAAALVDLADFIPTADADTDVIVLRPKTDH